MLATSATDSRLKYSTQWPLCWFLSFTAKIANFVGQSPWCIVHWQQIKASNVRVSRNIVKKSSQWEVDQLATNNVPGIAKDFYYLWSSWG